ncbi:MAG TPA: filamentous hemagglutinin N-terminal domain-containing protein [Candidatus Limnocylindria bacterium]|nr:filamentous hemagglutinin N-terminal domain-containing protein [Candidatus Limnocylindria bacterium]
MNSEGVWRRMALAGLATALAPSVFAAPQGPVVSAGSASITQAGSHTEIKASNGAVLNWASFNIGVAESVHFDQPTRTSVVWNFINGFGPSQILGNLSANGYVVLMNQNGFYFGPNSVVNVGGLVVTTGRPMAGFSEGGSWDFTAMPPLASIINYGDIRVSDKSSLFLIAEKIENHGILQAPDGTIGLYSGKEVLVSDRPDGRGLSAKVTLPSGSVDNQGSLIADAGSVAVVAQVVNIDGLIQANSVRERNGVIELTAEQSVSLGENADLAAKGDTTGVSSGGQITIKSAGEFKDAVGANISVAGGAQGGNGGKLEISSPQFTALSAHLEGSAANGYKGGSLFIDPDKIVLNKTGTGTGTALFFDVTSAFDTFGEIHLQANTDITVDTKGVWDLVATTGVSTPGSLLFLESGGNITLKDSSVIKAGEGWSVSLKAGVQNGALTKTGSIKIGGDTASVSTRAGIQSTTGDISLQAHDGVIVANGSVTTVGGGNIDVLAKQGDIRTGFVPDSYLFTTTQAPGYRISSSLGGISTAAGGNVTLTAEQGGVFADKQGLLQEVPGASGAFGSKPGNVTVTAKTTVSGVFNVANGAGIISSGGDVGVGQSGVSDGLSLQLIKGSWAVQAANNIYVNEVRNPSGTFNKTTWNTPLGRMNYYNDYAGDASASFIAGNGVVLQGIQDTAALPRITVGSNNKDLAAVYPPILNIVAGAGGVYMPTPTTGDRFLLNEVVLFPSAQGSLSITTTGGGSLYGDAGGTPRIVESDGALYASNSTRPQDSENRYSSYYDFTYLGAATAHRNSPNHAAGGSGSKLDISGSLSEIQVSFAQRADVKVGGNLFNAGLFYRQYSPLDTSTLHVDGTISYTSASAKVELAGAPNLDVITQAALAGGYRSDIFQRLFWNPNTKELIWVGAMTEAQRDFLLSPSIPEIDPRTGLPVLDAKGNFVLHPVVLVADNTKILDLYENAKNTAAPEGAFISVSGPGTLAIQSKSVDLGASEGIVSSGPDVAILNSEDLAHTGARIKMIVDGNLRLTSSRVSSSSAEGDIDITVLNGSLDVGAQDSLVANKQTGIFTTGSGDIQVTVDKDINVNGSRIATFRGGDIALKSLNGNIDAGRGGASSLEINGKLFQISGIAAVALTDTEVSPGNITVNAVKGDFRASRGGVFQASFNKNPSIASIDIFAGGDVDAGNSGVIGGSIKVDAGGTLKGNFFGSGEVSLQAQQSITANAFGQSVNVSSAQGNVSGTIVGGSVSVAGSSVDAAVISANATVAGNSAGAQVGTQATTGSSGPARTEQTTDQTVARASSKDDEDADERKKRLAAAPKLSRTVGRVTVVLPTTSKAQ